MDAELETIRLRYQSKIDQMEKAYLIALDNE